jgi:hypothetical protein
MQESEIDLLKNLKTDNYLKYLLVWSTAHSSERSALELAMEFIAEINSIIYKVSDDMTFALRLNWWIETLEKPGENAGTHPIISGIYKEQKNYQQLPGLCLEFVKERLSLTELEFKSAEDRSALEAVERYNLSEYKLLSYITNDNQEHNPEAGGELIASYSLLKFIPELPKYNSLGAIKISDQAEFSQKGIEEALINTARDYFNSCNKSRNANLLDKLIYTHLKYHLSFPNSKVLEILKGKKTLNHGWYRLKLLMNLII